MSTASDIGFPVRGFLIGFAAVVPLWIGCTDSAPPTEPSVVEKPTTPQPQPSTPTPGPASTGVENMYIANADGSAATRLTRGSWPSWSPDGRRIVFHRDSAIYVIDADGSHETRLAAGRWPAWSPDAATIVFTSTDGISVINADGSGMKTLIRHGFRDDTYKPWDMGVGKPTWSPDGVSIAFEHLGDGDIMPAQVFVMKADGSEPRLATASADGSRYAESDPSWSPDGSKLAYWSYWFGIIEVGRVSGIRTIIYGDFPTVAYGARPVWSPDGKAVAFNTFRFSSTAPMILIAKGGTVAVLIRDAYEASWSPDGGRIAFVSRRAP